ncbi:hypothetical protein [Novosphingobium cyanobacteriorum]|uniref:Transposase n=1 Tax=Novosphingobium cyanobacteriorum TaxID=3024215 RepID=A0ABT6CPY4_9SPHN|nr:hypothetical protein [Novosphingobium cyanobacteriorum]MDF8335539.1 hypothetical protein [Novosphingobium cyanobacteriorum]
MKSAIFPDFRGTVDVRGARYTQSFLNVISEQFDLLGKFGPRCLQQQDIVVAWSPLPSSCVLFPDR